MRHAASSLSVAEQSRIVKLPMNQVGSVSKVNREVSKFEQEHERRPSADELVDKVDLPEEKIEVAMKSPGKHVSMDAPFSDGEDNSLLDVIENTDSPMADRGLVLESLHEEVIRALTMLTERERNVVTAFYGIDQPEMTLDEIGDKYGLSRERVRQIKEKAIRKLRHNTKSKLLKTYLGS